MSSLSEGNRAAALSQINALMNQLQKSGGPQSIVQGTLNKLMAARSEIQAGAAPSMIMSNLNEAYALLAYL